MKFIIASILVLLIGFFSFRVTYAYLMSSQIIPHNTITSIGTATPSATLSVAPSISPSGVQTADHVVINEVYPEATGSGEWVELFNPTNNSVDVSGWIIQDNTDSDRFATPSAIPANGYAVVVSNNSVVSTIPNSAVTIVLPSAIGGGLNATDDRLLLSNADGNQIDAMSYGTDKTFFNLSAPSGSQTLGRHPNGVDADSANDWMIESSGSIGVTNP